MKTLLHRTFTPLFLTLLFTAGGCSDDSEKTYTLHVSKTEFKDLQAEGGELTLEISSDTQWSISTEASWIHFSQTEGLGEETITITVDSHNEIGAEARTALLIVRANNVDGEKTITITQKSKAGEDPEDTEVKTLSIDKNEFNDTTAEGGELILTITSNTDWAITCSENWIHLSETSGTGDKTIAITIDSYRELNAEPRTVTLIIKGKGVDGEKSATITQNADRAFVNVDKNKFENISFEGQELTLTITSNTDWAVTCSESWVQLSEASGTGNKTIAITIDPCAEIGLTQRIAYLTIASNGVPENKTITISQEKQPHLNVLDMITDDNFRAIVRNIFIPQGVQHPFMSEQEAKAIIRLDLTNIASLEGIEYFPSLISLAIDNSNLPNVNLSHLANLEDLILNNSNVTSINISNNPKLTGLKCENNQLTTLDLSTNTKLLTLYCKGNNLVSLNLSANAKLIELDCQNNQIASLNIEQCSDIEILNCSDNALASLDLQTNIELLEVNCSNNRLTWLNVSQSRLTELHCSTNLLTTIAIENSIDLKTFNCDNNQIANLNISRNTELTAFDCISNPLETLYVWWEGGLASKPLQLQICNVPSNTNLEKR